MQDPRQAGKGGAGWRRGEEGAGDAGAAEGGRERGGHSFTQGEARRGRGRHSFTMPTMTLIPGTFTMPTMTLILYITFRVKVMVCAMKDCPPL